MSEARKKYSREFKTEAVRLISEGGHKVAKVARDLGVNETMLYRWRKEFGEDPADAFPGQGNLKPEDAELRRLRRELELVRQECDILKKAISVFSREPR